MTLQLTWTGADGTLWDLSNGKVRLDAKGVEGLGQPVWNRQTISSAGSDGQRRTGQRSRANAREGYLPVILLGDDPGDWFTLSRSWWNSWDADTPGALRVTAPDGSYRFIECCLLNDDTYAPVQDPMVTSTEEAAVHWIADQPFWLGPQQTATFDVVDTTIVVDPVTVDFFNGGAAPPFNLQPGSPGSTTVVADTANLGVSNPGDLDAWPLYTITGPVSSFSVTINGHTVSGAINVVAGATLVVDTDPARQTAFLTTAAGVRTNVTPQLTAVDFAPIDKGASAVIAASAVGTGALVVSFYPRYKRAW